MADIRQKFEELQQAIQRLRAAPALAIKQRAEQAIEKAAECIEGLVIAIEELQDAKTD